MNNPNLDRRNRAIKKEREKAKRKTVIRLLGKERTDKRTSQNLREFFNHISYNKRFTGPEIVKNKHIKGSVLYPLIELCSNRHLIQKAGEKPSAGRGHTAIYTLTTTGKILSAYVTDNSELFREAMNELIEEECNPLKRFGLEACKDNFETDLIHGMLEHSIRRAENIITKGLDVDNLLSELIQNTFSLTSFMKPDVQLFKKNAALIEKSKQRDILFQYFKMQLESNFFLHLKEDKLKAYADSLKENPELLHIPCENEACLNVTILDSFLKINISHYCEKCTSNWTKKEHSQA
jgi:hypothetical protein